jgi:tetratricopeptide (TPR) repeat protein
LARKRATPAPPAPTPARVTAALRAGDFAAALDASRALLELIPTAESLILRKQAVRAAAAAFADRDRTADFNRVMESAAELDAADADWLAERVVLAARGGKVADALALADTHPDPAAARAKVHAHAADRAIRLQSKADLPVEMHPGFDAVLLAFRLHETGNEAAARGALEPIGLRSPFLEWKVLLRGLLAHAAGDDAQAAENFARLDASRLPARLAAPYRLAVDPAYNAAVPAADASTLAKQHQKLTTGPLVDGLRAVARELGRDRPLGPAFREAESVVPLLRQSAPHLVPRLANCFYHAVIHQGQPDDLPRFRRLFGEPADDPGFHKLLAQVGEQLKDRSGAHAHWQRYDAWLAHNPLKWPADLLARVRAAVWIRLGENAEDAAEEREDEPAMLGFFAPPRKPKRKPLDPPADACYRRAADLAPDWSVAVESLFGALVDANRPADAEAVARRFLARHPDDLRALGALAELVQRAGRATDAAALWLRVLALNPLDTTTRFRAATSLLAAARQTLAAGDADAADAMLGKHRPLLEDRVPAGYPALRSVIAVKRKEPELAAEYRAKAFAVTGGRLGVAYRVFVDSQLGKLKPADKKAADALFKEELEKPPTPHEVNQLIAAYDMYHIDGVAYRGQKTHEKTVLDQVPRCLTAVAPEEDFERLADLLVAKHEWKHAKKVGDAGITRFPQNPFFHLVRTEAGLNTGESEYYAEQRLRKAKRLAEGSAEPRHKALVERIDALLTKVALPFDFFADLFGDRG